MYIICNVTKDKKHPINPLTTIYKTFKIAQLNADIFNRRNNDNCYKVFVLRDIRWYHKLLQRIW